MKITFLVGCLTLALAATASGQDDFPEVRVFPDTPRNHWVFETLKQLKNDGMLRGYWDGLIYRRPPTTRNEIANSLVETAKWVEQVDHDLESRVTSLVETVDLTLGEPSTEQLQAELALLGDLNAIRPWADDFAGLAKLVRAFRKDVAVAGGDADAILGNLEAVGPRLDSRRPDSYWARTVSSFAALAKRRGTAYPDIPENHWVYEAVKDMRHDGLLVTSGNWYSRSSAPRRTEIAEAVVATYRRIKGTTDALDERIRALSNAIDENDQTKRQELRAKLAAIQKDVDSLKPWGDHVANLVLLTKEFRADIAAMGVDVKAMLRDLGDYQNRTMSLRRQP